MKKALLIIDLQRGFKPSKALVSNILEIIENYDLAVATQLINGNPLFQKILHSPRLRKGEVGLVGLPKEVRIFKKKGYGLPSALLKFLEKKSIKEVDVCGLETDACVLAAMYNLWDAGIKPNLISELSTTPRREIRKATLKIMKRNFGT